MAKREDLNLSVYNVIGVLDSIRDRYRDKLTQKELTALIIAANTVLESKEIAEKEIKKHLH